MRGVAFIARGDFGIGRLDTVAERTRIESRIPDRPAFGANEDIAVVVVIGAQHLGVGLAAGGIGCRGQESDRTAATLLEQLRIAIGELVGHGCAEAGRDKQLLRQQAGPEVFADLRIGDPLLGQRLAIGVLAEIAIGPAEGGDHADLAVDEIVARADAVLLREAHDGRAVDQRFERSVQPAFAQECLHGRRRLVLAERVEPVIGGANEIGCGNLLVADHCHAVSAGYSPESSGARNIRAGEGESDQAEERQRDGQTELGLEEVTKKLEHGVRAIPLMAAIFRGHPDGLGRFIPHATARQQVAKGFDARRNLL